MNLGAANVRADSLGAAGPLDGGVADANSLIERLKSKKVANANSLIERLKSK